MSTPSYSNLIKEIAKRLRQDNRLNSVKDDSIVEGSNLPRVVVWPAITVSLEEVEEVWRSFAERRGGRKDAIHTVRLTVLDRVASGKRGYTDGLDSVQDLVQTIDNIIQSDITISGVARMSETTIKRFTEGVYDNTPVISAEVILTTTQGFTRAY